MPSRLTLFRPIPAILAPLLALALGGVLSPGTAHAQREVVQPLPSPDMQRLNRALMELARRPNRLESLIEAAEASFAVEDFDAAIGFYGRAARLAPADPRVKLGFARTYLHAGRPVAALPLFSDARTAGAPPRDVLPGHGLALDLVGDQKAAQAAYKRALELDPGNDEVRRRLAVSQAISGSADAFQATLSPLLEARDFAAFRARAFGLAILGESERAGAIVEAVMPPDLAARIVPYLAFMERLTPAQQAAAANLGIFPRAANIGREAPAIARLSREEALGSALEPAGEPLGQLTRTVSREVAQPTAQAGVAPAAQADATDRNEGNPAALPRIATREAAPQETAPRGPAARETASVTEAFTDLERETGEFAPRADAVDLAAIEIPRDPPPAPPAPNHPRRVWVQVATGQDIAALGFDWRRLLRKAPALLGEFDPHTVPWGQANRLLAGPVADDAAARALINALAERGIDTFPYTSPEGTEIQRIE